MPYIIKVRNKRHCAVQVRKQAEEEANSSGMEKKEMVTPQLRKALVRQGYKIVGSHSGVKLCRWTKVIQSTRVVDILLKYEEITEMGSKKFSLF